MGAETVDHAVTTNDVFLRLMLRNITQHHTCVAHVEEIGNNIVVLLNAHFHLLVRCMWVITPSLGFHYEERTYSSQRKMLMKTMNLRHNVCGFIS